jgi:hypothetical protein
MQLMGWSLWGRPSWLHTSNARGAVLTPRSKRARCRRVKLKWTLTSITSPQLRTYIQSKILEGFPFALDGPAPLFGKLLLRVPSSSCTPSVLLLVTAQQPAVLILTESFRTTSLTGSVCTRYAWYEASAVPTCDEQNAYPSLSAHQRAQLLLRQTVP